MKNKRIVIILATSLLVVSSSANFVSADDDNSINVIRFYGPSTCQISDSTNRSIYLKSEITEDSPLAEWVSNNYAAVTSLAAEYGLPWEPIMAQGAIESDFGTSEAFEQRGIIFALGPDGNGLSKEASYPDVESSWRVLFEYLRLKAGSNRSRIFSEDTVRTPNLYIDAITEAGYNPGLSQGDSYESQLRDLTSEIDLIVERANLQASKEILKNTLAMEGNIERNRGKGVNNFGNASEYTSTECNCGGDAGASGVRWSNYWASNNSLYGSQKTPVIGMEAEKSLSAKDYGLNIQGTQPKLNFRIKNGTEFVNGDPYAAYPDRDYPHFLIDIKKKRIFQYFPVNLSSATENSGNVEKGIVVDIVGFTDEDNSGSNYYLWDTKKNTNAEWRYLATLVDAIYEESNGITAASKDGDSGEIWSKISSYLNFTEHKAAVKCATLEDSDVDLKEFEVKRFVNHYNNSVSLNDYGLPLSSKSMPASFVAYFASRFTSLDTDKMTWGEPRDVVKNLTANYPSLKSGNDPAPFAVFSSTNSSIMCGSFSCGSTGVIFGIDNGLAITVEQSYPSGKVEVKKRSLADVKNSKYDTSFVYLRSVINEEELNLGKVGQ